MPQPQSHGGMDLIIDGERVTELADEDPPIEIGERVVRETTRGMDGAMYVRGTNQVGATLTVKLLPTATQVKKWMQELALIQNGEDGIVHRGSYGDPRLGYTQQLEGVYLISVSAGAGTPGVTVEFVFDCERIIVDYDNARF